MNPEVFFVIIILVIPALYFFTKVGARNIHFFEFRVFFLCLAALNGISPIARALLLKEELYNIDYFRFSVYAAALIFFIICYEITSPMAIPGGRTSTADKKYSQYFGFAGAILLSLGILFLLKIVSDHGLEFFLIPKAQVYVLYRTMGPEKLAREFITNGVVLLFFSSYHRKQKFSFVIIAMVIIVIVLAALLKMRSAMGMAIIASLYFYHHLRKPISNKTIAFYSVLTLLFFGLFHLITGYFFGYEAAVRFEDPNWWAVNVVFFQFNSWYQIWSDVWQLDPLLGATVFNAIKASLFPNFLGGETISLSTWYTMQFHPVVAEQGGGFAFSFIVEAYMNFGLGGVFMLFGILGYFARKADTLAPGQLLYLRGIFFAHLVDIFFHDLNAMLKNSVSTIVIPYILFFFFMSVHKLLASISKKEKKLMIGSDVVRPKNYIISRTDS